jgi:thioredoxin 1
MLALDKENFQAEVKDEKGYVLVDYWSESCEPCKALMPDIQALAEKYGSQVKFAKLDTAKARRLAISEQVLGLPTIALYKDGQKIEEVTKDSATISNIEAMIQKNL